MNAFHAATMSSFNQNARGSPPLAVRTIHALRSRSTSAGSARFNSAGLTPVDAITMNRALVLASVRLAATVRNVFGDENLRGWCHRQRGHIICRRRRLGSVQHTVQVSQRLHPVVYCLRGVLVLEPRPARFA